MIIYKVDEWTVLVVSFLTKQLGKTNFEKLNNLLIENKGFIAGGSILKAVTNFPQNKKINNDLDIYINTKNIPNFLNKLQTDIIKPTSHDVYWASTYCVSFLRKNGIKRVYKLEDVHNNLLIDVMSVRNKRSLLDVVTNFDLTFCQIWYDGSDVYATHPEDINLKEGSLQKDYVQLYLSGNKFLELRLEKYKKRGFKINIKEIDEDKRKLIVSYACQKDNYEFGSLTPININSERTKKWVTRVALRYSLGIRDMFSKNNVPLLKIPLNAPNYKSKNQLDILPDQNELYSFETGKYVLKEDDGYDTDDVDEKSLIDISIDKYHTNETELANSPIDPKLIYGRTIFNLLLNYLTPNKDEFIWNFGKILSISTYLWDSWIGDYFQAIKTHLLKKGEDFLGNEGLIYHIHNHPLDGGITQEGLEGYLTGHIKDVDKNAIPCFWKPESDRLNPKNCQKTLSLLEIEAVVSRNFYEKFTAPAPVKSGLDQIINAYNAVLTNEKSTTDAWGNIFHATMCPFCLQYEQRDEGCAYMGHDNPKHLTSTEHPYCQKEFLVKELREKYLTLGKRIDRFAPDHLEFCVECGRPCWHHQHFKLDGSDFVKNKILGEEGARHIDYTSCTGGGRVELIARILAVRDVYANGKHKKPKEERKAAALAADDAPNNRELMERARIIFEKESKDRKWNNNIPKKKNYNNIAYEEQEGGKKKKQKTHKKKHVLNKKKHVSKKK